MNTQAHVCTYTYIYEEREGTEEWRHRGSQSARGKRMEGIIIAERWKALVIGENKRTIDRPKVNQLIIKIIN